MSLGKQHNYIQQTKRHSYKGSNSLNGTYNTAALHQASQITTDLRWAASPVWGHYNRLEMQVIKATCKRPTQGLTHSHSTKAAVPQ